MGIRLIRGVEPAVKPGLPVGPEGRAETQKPGFWIILYHIVADRRAAIRYQSYFSKSESPRLSGLSSMESRNILRNK